ncbi:hypothetical protein V3390_00225 [Luteimonas sp. FXH3W]|uniref:KTSC domain-containing protein n=1 Tax=Aquilutibacter rugosus TaxID=3115820 RepID=A0ABU7UXD9_9GAMM
MAVRTIEGVRVRSRHHQHYDGRAVVTISWNTKTHKVDVNLHFASGKTEEAFDRDFDVGRYDPLIRNTISEIDELVTS